MLHLTTVECEPVTNVGIQVLWYKITSAKAEILDNNASKILEHVASTMILITDQGETH